VFENRTLSRIFGPKRRCKMRLEKLENDKFHNTYCFVNNNGALISSRVTWAGRIG
jgi:hypothetical protein